MKYIQDRLVRIWSWHRSTPNIFTLKLRPTFHLLRIGYDEVSRNKIFPQTVSLNRSSEQHWWIGALMAVVGWAMGLGTV
eukprot:2576454-Prorocentrum_lima.AAC.1